MDSGDIKMKSVEISDAGGELLERLLQSGNFKDEQEVVEVSLRLCQSIEEMQLEEERRLVKEGIAAYRAGDYAPWDAEEVKQLGRKLLRERTQNP